MTKPTLIISNYDSLTNPYYAGGGAVAIHEVAKRLTRSFLVTVITAAHPHSKNKMLDRVKYVHIGPTFVGPRLGQLIFLALLPFFAIKEKYAIWVESFTPPFASLFLNLFTQKPVIGLTHLLPALDMERKYHLPFHLIENLILKSRQRFIVLSHELAHYVKKINPTARITIIPNGVYLPKIAKNTSPAHILFIGRLEFNQKGLDLLLSAYAKAASKSIPHLLIAGSGSSSDVSQIRTLINSYGLGAKVKLVGKIHGARRDAIYRNSLFVILPSRYEAFSLVALETLSYGLPLLCFNITGLKWIPKTACCKVPAFNVQKLSQAITSLSTHPILRRSIGKKALLQAKKYNWDAVGKKFQTTLLQALSTSHA